MPLPDYFSRILQTAETAAEDQTFVKSLERLLATDLRVIRQGHAAINLQELQSRLEYSLQILQSDDGIPQVTGDPELSAHLPEVRQILESLLALTEVIDISTGEKQESELNETNLRNLIEKLYQTELQKLGGGAIGRVYELVSGLPKEVPPTSYSQRKSVVVKIMKDGLSPGLTNAFREEGIMLHILNRGQEEEGVDYFPKIFFERMRQAGMEKIIFIEKVEGPQLSQLIAEERLD